MIRAIGLAAAWLAVFPVSAGELLTNNGGRAADHGITYAATPVQAGWPEGSVLTDGNTRTSHYAATSLRWPAGTTPRIEFALGRQMLVTEVVVWFSGRFRADISTAQIRLDCADAEWRHADYPATSSMRVKDLALRTDAVTLEIADAAGPVEVTEVEIWGEPTGDVSGFGDLRFSVWPPVGGERVTVSVALRNVFGRALLPDRVTFRAALHALFDDEEQVIGEVDTEGVPPRKAHRAVIEWTPRDSGWYTIRVTGGGMGELEAQVPVVRTPLYFAWYGVSPGQPLKWVNVAMHARGLEAERWIERGALPLSWAGGYCYKEKTEGEFVTYWGDLLAQSERGIAIDEFGCDYGGEVDQKMAAALRRVKAEHPDGFVLAWSAGPLSDVLTAGYRESANLVLPEVYMQYLGWHYPVFDRIAEQARAAGIADKTVFGLCTTTDKGGVTKEQLEEQFRYIKRLAPEFPGVAFYNAYRVAPGMIEWADELCYRYFIAPVLTVKESERDEWILRNIGGIDARDVWMKWGERGDSRPLFLPVRAGGAVRLKAPVRGARPIIVESFAYTVLDGD
ncbi:MAG: hypothetical protein JSV65_06755 [Armatimonadota bacterium]|nr:MAG: hypothetical protein JSV65_06755 [Armatimonadota bacterium]